MTDPELGRLALAEARAYLACLRAANRWDANTGPRHLDRGMREAHTAWTRAKETLRTAELLRLEVETAGAN